MTAPSDRHKEVGAATEEILVVYLATLEEVAGCATKYAGLTAIDGFFEKYGQSDDLGIHVIQPHELSRAILRFVIAEPTKTIEALRMFLIDLLSKNSAVDVAQCLIGHIIEEDDTNTRLEVTVGIVSKDMIAATDKLS